MQSAAKRKTLRLSWIASALLLCAPTFASSVASFTEKTRAELSGTTTTNRVEFRAATPEIASRYYDASGEVASDSPVAPKGAVETLTHRNRIYEVVTEQGISGTTRAAHRASANRALLKTIDCDPQFARQLGEILGVDDVAAHMRSGRSGLLNPPGTEWHHPMNNPAVMRLLRRQVHRHPELQDILHPDNIGGFGTHFGN